MIDFSKCTKWDIPEGTVVQVTDANGNVLWKAPEIKRETDVPIEAFEG